MVQQVKDPVLSMQQHWSQLWLNSVPGQEFPYATDVGKKKKKKNINLIALKKGKLRVVRLVEMQDNKDMNFISCSENQDYAINITYVVEVDIIEFIIVYM